jgi:predicted HNH restriction endonuclease
MTSTRISDFQKWLGNQEFAGRKYSPVTIRTYPYWLDSRLADIFNIPDLGSVFNILDVKELKTLEDKYMSGNLSKTHKDLRSAFHKYIEFCEFNEFRFDKNNNIDDNPDILCRTEGGKKVVISVRAERDPALREEAIRIHKLNCQVCGFNFQEKYGDQGKNFIEVHHAKPLAEGKFQPSITNPETDLNVVCSNCHRMLHRKKGITLTIDELKQKLMK